MKPHRYSLRLLLVWALFLLCLPLFTAQSQTPNFSPEQENSPIAFENRRQLESSISKSSDKNPFVLNTAEELALQLPPNEWRSVIYYSDQEDSPVNFKIRFVLATTETKRTTAVHAALRTGQMLKGRFWSETDFEGEGQEISLQLDSRKIYNGYLQYIFPSQKGQKGKYLIEIANLWEFTLVVAVSMEIEDISDQFRPTMWPIMKFSQNFEDDFDFQMNDHPQRIFEIFTAAPGKWYLWVESCGHSVILTIQNGKETPIRMEIPSGGSYFHQETIEKKAIEAREDLFRIVTITTLKNKPYGWERKVSVSAVLIDEPEFRNYELKEDPKNLTVTYWGNETWPWPGKAMVVRFSPLKLQEAYLTDSVEYTLELLWKNPEITWDSALVARPIPFPIYHRKQIELCFFESGLTESEQYLRVKAYVKYNSQTMRVFTYPIGYVNFNDTSFEEKERPSTGLRTAGIVAVGIVTLAFVVAVVVSGFKKVVAWRRRPVVDAGEQEVAFEDEGEARGLNEDASVVVERSE